MNELIKSLYFLANSPQFLFFAIIFSVCIKLYLLYSVIPLGFRFQAVLKPWVFLLGVIVGSLVGDAAWLIKLVRSLFFPTIQYSHLLIVLRLSWGFLIIQYQSLALFMESLTQKNYVLILRQKVLFLVSTFFACYFIYIAFFNQYLTDPHERAAAFMLPVMQAPLEILMFRYTILYLLVFITIPSFLRTMYTIRTTPLPRILKKQLRIFMAWFIVPYLIIEFLIAIQQNFTSLYNHTYAIVGISTILLALALYYCLNKVVQIRFLNTEPISSNFNNTTFINHFKQVLEQLSHTTSNKEIEQVVKTFFKETFKIHPQRTHLYIRSLTTQTADITQQPVQQMVENFITSYSSSSKLYQFIKKTQVIICDDIEFKNFYHNNQERSLLIKAMHDADVDIFLPIYQQHTIIAYIIIEKFSRPQEFFDTTEHYQMAVFTNYLSNIINLLQNRNVASLVQQEKELKEELYNKQQEINQYRECIQKFVRNSKNKDIGIIFYKNRRFIFGNQVAKEIIGINLNLHDGHPITKKLKELIKKVFEYKTAHSMIAHDAQGTKIILSGLLNTQESHAIITVYYPEVSDILRKKLHLLNDPSKWDYLLYLETTESGKLIHHMIPGSGENMLNFKIELLKIALHKKALVLTIPEEDLLPMVEILHHINLRKDLEMLSVTSSNSTDIAIKLFGINAVLASSKTSQPFFERCNGTGTIFLQNIHLLNLEVQEYLAEFIKYGVYRIFRSDQKMTSDVRIICSTNQNLATLVREGKFNPDLFHELKTTTLSMPSLLNLPDHELHELTDGFTQQAITNTTFKNILELSDREKEKIIISRPTSLQELKMRVQRLLIQKSKKTNIYHETQFNPAYHITSPDLTHAAQLGKHALKDPQIMTMLWNKFKNQNQIAALLGVNRSSVNRRCKDYNLE